VKEFLEGRRLGFAPRSPLAFVAIGLGSAATLIDLMAWFGWGARDTSAFVAAAQWIVVTTFVVVGVAFLALLIAAGLLVRSFMHLQQIQLNFNPDNILTMHIDLPDARYPEDRMNYAFFNQLLPRLSAQPNVFSEARA